MEWSSIKLKRGIWIASVIIPLWTGGAHGQELERWKTKTAEYKQWLDSIKSDGQRFWVSLDRSQRPHRLYIGEGFHKANYQAKEYFVETFSRYLAGHPEKFMLIDIFDAATGNPIGEFGWGGFRLYPSSLTGRSREELSKR